MGERLSPQDVLKCIGAAEAASSEKEIVRVFSRFIARFGFRSIALGYLINPASAIPDNNFQVTDWPEDWYQRWRDSDFIIHDPIARFALRSRQSFTWRTAYEYGSRFGKEILDESRNFGFADGLAIPVWTPDGPPGCVSLGADQVDLSPQERLSLELVAIHVYARLEVLFGPRPLKHPRKLTRRETDVLQYAAAGKTNWEIGGILSLSEGTVRNYICSAISKLNCTNRSHAVAVAIQRALILP